MISLRIARRYAKALMAIGKEDGQAETYKEELGGFVKLLEEQKEFEQAISNPLYDAEGRKKVLQAVVERSGLSRVMASFLFLLFDKGRIQYLGDIYDFYEKLTDELANIVRADLVSATDLAEETLDPLAILFLVEHPAFHALLQLPAQPTRKTRTSFLVCSLDTDFEAPRRMSP